MIYIGIDIGSTATKVAVRGDYKTEILMPTGWNSRQTALDIKQKLLLMDIDPESPSAVCAATGYGRIAVDFADYTITEITCHGRGGFELAKEDCAVIDVGGQDTKVIHVANGKVSDFLMNDKCSAGTGKFIEIMANRLGVTIDEIFELSAKGKVLPISSLCTVFAESEIINYIGEGQPRENIAAGVIDSVAVKVAQLYNRKTSRKKIILTGGLSHSAHFARTLEAKIGKPVGTMQLGRFAGALGAALLAEEKVVAEVGRGEA